MNKYKRLHDELKSQLDAVESATKTRNIRRSKVALLYWTLRNSSALLDGLLSISDTNDSIDDTEAFKPGDKVLYGNERGTITAISPDTESVYVKLTGTKTLVYTTVDRLTFDYSKLPDTASVLSPLPKVNDGITESLLEYNGYRLQDTVIFNHVSGYQNAKATIQELYCRHLIVLTTDSKQVSIGYRDIIGQEVNNG